MDKNTTFLQISLRQVYILVVIHKKMEKIREKYFIHLLMTFYPRRHLQFHARSIYALTFRVPLQSVITSLDGNTLSVKLKSVNDGALT